MAYGNPPTTQALRDRPTARAFASRWLLPLCAVLALLILPPSLAAQAPPETVGRIEGEDIVVKGAARVDVESGRSTTVLASGSEVTVRSGQARLVLVEGGEIGICAPAHFSLLKSGGAITLALNYGRLRVRLEPGVPLTVFSPLILAMPIAVGSGPRDVTIGLEASGEMCALAARGAVRIEQQLTSQSILVPQSGEVALAAGMLESLHGTSGSCQCEVLSARTEPPPRPKPPELSVPAPAHLARPVQPVKPESKKVENLEEAKPPAIEQPVYKVMMPPLTFDAAAPAPPPDPSPETILLVREVRVQPEVVFRGRVEPPPARPAKQPVQAASAKADTLPKKQGGVFGKIGGFFRRIFGRKPCAGAGCGETG